LFVLFNNNDDNNNNNNMNNNSYNPTSFSFHLLICKLPREYIYRGFNKNNNERLISLFVLFFSVSVLFSSVSFLMFTKTGHQFAIPTFVLFFFAFSPFFNILA